MPRIISQEEAEKIGSRPIGKMHPVRVALLTLPKDQTLHITRTEFNWKKRTPLFFINQITKATGKKFTICETKNRLGWLVKRVE